MKPSILSLRSSALFAMPSLVAIFFSLPALAQPPAPSAGPIPFDVFDQDRSGQISSEEFALAHQGRMSGPAATSMPSFNDIDANGDGALSPGELSAQQRRPGRGLAREMPTFDDFDLDDDGRLTETEFLQARAQRIATRSQQGYAMRGLATAPDFTTLDRNADGLLDAAEFDAALSEHHPAPVPLR